MAKRMLIDATHPEETRVVVLNGNRLEEFDFESSTKKQVKGNIYLAKVTRVEPSLQAAFVDYGGNRHGFLPFSEIHPDYYRIPVSDRAPGDWDRGEAEMPEPAEWHAAAAAPAACDEEAGVPIEAALPEPVALPAARHAAEEEEPLDAPTPQAADEEEAALSDEGGPEAPDGTPEADAATAEQGALPAELPDEPSEPAASVAAASPEEIVTAAVEGAPVRHDGNGEAAGGSESVETLGGDEIEEAQRQRSRATRHYKIQEVVKRRQIMLVQVTKEERGNKGAALTTYLSLAGRYCVLMPNTGRGGGVSRKITSLSDRRRLKEVLEELDLPEGMGVIVRTAGSERSKAEIKRDYEYLLRL
ncbi:MAG TPA: ribonuclease E/G, partial [Stellaceae bacterium]|nr:ribonuclease E/G [Stellaceae bacterium]